MIIITRKIREVHFALVTLVFGLMGVGQAYIMAVSFGNNGGVKIPEGLTETLLTLGVAGLTLVGQVGMVLALKYEDAGHVAILRSCDVVFGLLIQVVFMGVIPDVWRYE
jgi:drug/metabolite transporter (DMT)-like permease